MDDPRVTRRKTSGIPTQGGGGDVLQHLTVLLPSSRPSELEGLKRGRGHSRSEDTRTEWSSPRAGPWAGRGREGKAGNLTQWDSGQGGVSLLLCYGDQWDTLMTEGSGREVWWVSYTIRSVFL